ncbi:MAG: glycoside hydrolase family 104 protein [Sulfuricaulis sp.]|nr:glycoside hydrolase family 104 protein [Sulfuricaulis sp.]
MNRADLKEALQHPNVTAFLRAIRLGEGTSDELGYYRIVGGGSFTDDSVHPRVKVYLPKYDVYSTAAGAYQIIWPTWTGLCKQYAFPDFTPDTQDEAAVALIAEKHALADVKAGRLGDAVEKCAAIWASLPGSEAGQRTESMAAVKEEYLSHGGTLA